MATVTTQDEFMNAITAQESEIIVAQSINLTSPATIGYAVTIRGSEGVSLFWSNPTTTRYTMFTVTGANADLTIEALTLDAEGRNGLLVQVVSDGRFTMNAGAVLKNIYSRSSRNAVRIGEYSQPYTSGTFIMNGGLITGVDSSDAVYCGSGTVIMNNDAEISDNLSAGVTMTSNVTGFRSSLTMTGRSRIADNESRQGANAGIIMNADIFMGVSEGDAPIVTGNHTDTYGIGAWYLAGNTTLTMRFDAEISDNYALQYAGGIAAQGSSTIAMYDRAAIKNNRTGGFGGGVLVATETAVTMEDQAEISGNVCASQGGGMNLQSGSTFAMSGTAAIKDNTAAVGGGLFIASPTATYPTPSTASIGLNNSAPTFTGNTATSRGGGIFISSGTTLLVTGHTRFEDNTAPQGLDIYKMGQLELSQSPRILDGLFFDDLQLTAPDDLSDAPPEDWPPVRFQIPLDVPEGEDMDTQMILNTFAFELLEHSLPAPFQDTEPRKSENIPLIVGPLTEDAIIQLESSPYVSSPNVSLVIAERSEEAAKLSEPDRAAWRIPADFGAGYSVILDAALDQVLIVFAAFDIIYHNLRGAENPNPTSYNIPALPITLLPPGKRPGYAFLGWRNAAGELVTEIPTGTTGAVQLTALWEQLSLSFDGNGTCVQNVPQSMPAGQGVLTIPSTIPCRPGYRFICWNIPASGEGKAYFPGDTLSVSDSSITLYAQWQRMEDCCQPRRAPRNFYYD